MDSLQDKTLKIYSGKRAWYELVLAAIFFSITIFTFLLFLYQLLFKTSSFIFVIGLYKFFIYGLPSLASGITFSATKDIEIEDNTIVTRYLVGKFSKKIVSKVSEFEYVSVFNNGNDVFQTLLWYTGNKHYEMFCFDDKKSAFDFALIVSNKLNIDLLDATNKGDFQWVDKIKL